MPRLSTKITVKLEPELLKDLHETADDEGRTISECVREAVLRYIRERRETERTTVLRLNLTRYERTVVNGLVNLGIADDPEEIFHRSFGDFVSGEGLKGYMETLRIVRNTRPIDENTSSGSDSRSYESFDFEPDSDENGDEQSKEGE